MTNLDMNLLKNNSNRPYVYYQPVRCVDMRSSSIDKEILYTKFFKSIMNNKKIIQNDPSKSQFLFSKLFNHLSYQFSLGQYIKTILVSLIVRKFLYGEIETNNGLTITNLSKINKPIEFEMSYEEFILIQSSKIFLNCYLIKQKKQFLQKTKSRSSHNFVKRGRQVYIFLFARQFRHN